MLVSGAASSIAGGLTPSEHFNTVLYTGNNSTNVITGVGFQSDLIWFKGRSAAQHHQLSNSQFAVGEHLTPNNTNGTITSGSGQDLTSIDSDGFTLGSSNFDRCNVNGTTYVAWNWKANGAGVSNTNGTITSTVSANADAGFSIVSYTGNSTSGATVGHGLSSAPEMVIVKVRDIANNWGVLHKYDTTRANVLNAAAASESGTGWWSSTTPHLTANYFRVGGHDETNSSSHTYIAYCFHSVEGFSKVGSYTGNGSADGTFVYTGFRPAYVMQKHSTSAEDWNIFDNERGVSYNLVDDYLRANDSGAEVSNHSTVRMDLVSNGFKIRGTNSGINTDGATFIYLAFAEHPFKHTNAR